MAAKVPDNVTSGVVERIVLGSVTLFILDFITENLDDGDTVDVSNLVSVCKGAWMQGTTDAQTSAPGIVLSGTGNTTLTFDITVANWNGRVFVLGTP